MAQQTQIPFGRPSMTLSAAELQCLSLLRKVSETDGPMHLRLLTHRCVEQHGTTFAVTPRGRTALLLGRF